MRMRFTIAGTDASDLIAEFANTLKAGGVATRNVGYRCPAA